MLPREISDRRTEILNLANRFGVTEPDRDVNAAVNLRTVAETSFTASPGGSMGDSCPTGADRSLWP